MNKKRHKLKKLNKMKPPVTNKKNWKHWLQLLFACYNNCRTQLRFNSKRGKLTLQQKCAIINYEVARTAMSKTKEGMK